MNGFFKETVDDLMRNNNGIKRLKENMTDRTNHRTIGKIFLAFLFFLVSFNVSFAATYFVSSSSGNDSNPGTSIAPWERCPGLTGWSGTINLLPGDIIYFRNTDVWTSSTGSSLLEPVGGVTYDGSTWGNGNRAKLRALIDYGRGVVTFRDDHPTRPTAVQGFEVDANDTVSAGIVFDWGFAPTDLTGAIKRVKDCIVHDVYSRSAQGDYKYGIVISKWGGGAIENVEVIDCEIYNISRSGIVNYLGNDVPGNSSKNILIRGCNIYNTGEDPNSVGNGITVKNHAIDTLVEYNYVHDVAGGGVSIDTNNLAGFIGPNNCVVRFNIIRGCNGRWSSPGINADYSGDKSFDIYGNLIFLNAAAGIRLTDRLDNMLSGRIYNNTLYQNCQSTRSREIDIQGFDASVSLLEVKNNIVSTRSDTTPLYDRDGDITVHSNNIYYKPGEGTIIYSNGTNYIADTIGGWEPSAVITDPLLKNISNSPTGFSGTYGSDLAPNNDGFDITANSPAKNSGISLNVLYNGSVNSVARSLSYWDIGAYEHNDPLSPPSPPENPRIVQ
jgi:hypothetical protein